jgi:hypothetical protein
MHVSFDISDHFTLKFIVVHWHAVNVIIVEGFSVEVVLSIERLAVHRIATPLAWFRV